MEETTLDRLTFLLTFMVSNELEIQQELELWDLDRYNFSAFRQDLAHVVASNVADRLYTESDNG